MRRSLLPRPGPLLLGLVMLGVGISVGTPMASATGILPPNDPSANIPFEYTPNCATDCTATLVTDTNYARAQEGVGPMVLPSDYATLTPAEQLLAITDSE